MPAEDSRVTIRLEQQAAGTLVRVTHEVNDKVVADQLVQGWRFHFSMFANAVANYVNAGAPERCRCVVRAVDGAGRGGAGRPTLRRIAAPKVKFRDRYSRLDGIDEVVAHIGASQRFMPGIGLERKGDVRHCQGTVLADWVARCQATGKRR